MLKQRFITASILVPIVLLILVYANNVLLMGTLGLVVGMLAWEWTLLVPIQQTASKLGYVFISLILSFAMFWVLAYAFFGVIILWLGITLLVITYPRTLKIWGKYWVVGSMGWVMLGLFASSFWGLYHTQHGLELIVYIFCLVWATDTGAYFAGKCWGQHKLIPRVSPGKTYEGSLGGLGSALCVAGVGLWYFQPTAIGMWFMQAIVLILLSMIGDLVISMLKRRSQVKDTGTLLPGHGGILDRLDSLIAVLPLSYYFFQP
jgi:CDP-diglyceride synthetase